jgi:hypothetical protein
MATRIHREHYWSDIALSPGVGLIVALLVIAYSLAAWGDNIVPQFSIRVVGIVLTLILLGLGFSHWRIDRGL